MQHLHRPSTASSGLRLLFRIDPIWRMAGVVTARISGPVATALRTGVILLLAGIGMRPQAALAETVTYSSITAGAGFACVVKNDTISPWYGSTTNSVLCWGNAIAGELGNGYQTTQNMPQPTPVAVTGLVAAVKQVSAGNGFACAVTTTQSVQCWGFNWKGQAGQPTNQVNVYQAKLVNMGSAVQVSAGGDHACAVNTLGQVYCWGGNDFGQLGMPPSGPTPSPHLVPLPYAAVSVSAGSSASCAVLHNPFYWQGWIIADPHYVYCWGSNEYGVLGNANYANYSPPVYVAGMTSDMTAVSMGDTVACALSGSGKEWCWGFPGGPVGDDGEIGSAQVYTNNGFPAPTPGAQAVAQGNWGNTLSFKTIATGSQRYSNCSADTTALGDSGMACWGNDVNYQLGIGNLYIDHIGFPVASGTFGDSSGIETYVPPTEIALSYDFGCALSSNYVLFNPPTGPTYTNHVFCWGANYTGQLATPTTTGYLTVPTLVF